MHQGQLAFAQMMRHLLLTTFRRCLARHVGEHKVRSFSCLVSTFAWGSRSFGTASAKQGELSEEPRFSTGGRLHGYGSRRIAGQPVCGSSTCPYRTPGPSTWRYVSPLVTSDPLDNSNSPAAAPERSTSSMATYHGVPSGEPDTRRSPPKFTSVLARLDTIAGEALPNCHSSIGLAMEMSASPVRRATRASYTDGSHCTGASQARIAFRRR